MGEKKIIEVIYKNGKYLIFRPHSNRVFRRYASKEEAIRRAFNQAKREGATDVIIKC